MNKIINTPSESSRLTIDIPKKYHQLLKAKAALLGKSLKEVVLDALEADVCLASSHEPNKETEEVIREIEQEINANLFK